MNFLKIGLFFFMTVFFVACSSTHKKNPKIEEKKKSARTETIKVEDEVIIFADSYRIRGKEAFFNRNENGDSESSYEISFSDQPLLPLALMSSNMEMRTLSRDQFSQDNEMLPIWFATAIGDCDVREESFSKLKNMGKFNLVLEHFKWILQGKGECSGNKKTTCTLELVSQEVFDLQNKTLISHDEKLSNHKKRLWTFSGEGACSESSMKKLVDKIN